MIGKSKQYLNDCFQRCIIPFISLMNVMARNWRDKLLVASIDFGTTFSGYAVSFKHDYDPRNPTILSQPWRSGDGPITQKTPTCVLLDPQCKFHSFGYGAEEKYATLAENDNHKQWHLFRRFKMLLYKDKDKRGLTLNDNIRDTEGREFPAIHIFSYAIDYMKRKVVEFVRDRYSECGEDDIYYVLTTPAIWSEQAKAFMRKAASNAKIKDDHLRIALEPESAAIFLQKSEFSALQTAAYNILKPGTCHMIADLGGGTIDIAAHRISDDGKFEEVIPPLGCPWGSDNINMEFENFVVKISGGQAFRLFKTEHVEDYLQLQRQFEQKKCAFVEQEDEDAKVTIVVPVSFGDIHKEHNREDLTMSVRQMDICEHVEFKINKMRIHQRQFIKFFKHTLDGVIDTIKDALKKIPYKIDTISCVGGFSDSDLLKKTLRRVFPDIKVVIPPDAVTTVMKGAVIFGRDQSVVDTRISPYTFGLDWNEDFDECKHPTDKKEDTGDGYVCKDIFKMLIKKGDPIKYNQSTQEIDAYPTSKYQHIMEFPFYRSEIVERPKFVTDIGCHLVGRMKIAITPCLHDIFEGSCVKLKVYFGETELRAEATDDQGRMHDVTFSYADTQV